MYLYYLNLIISLELQCPDLLNEDNRNCFDDLDKDPLIEWWR